MTVIILFAFILILSLIAVIQPVIDGKRTAIVLLVAYLQIIAGLLLLVLLAQATRVFHRGYINPQAKIIIIIISTWGIFTLVSAGLGMLRLKKWAIIISLITTPFLCATCFFIALSFVAGFPLAPILSLLGLITVIILEVVYVKRQRVGTELTQSDKAAVGGQKTDFRFISEYFSWFSKIKSELLAIIVCLLILLLLKYFHI